MYEMWSSMVYGDNKLLSYIYAVKRKKKIMVWKFHADEGHYFISSSKTLVTVPSVPLSITISPIIEKQAK